MSSQYVICCSVRTGVEISLENLKFTLCVFLLFTDDADLMLFCTSILLAPMNSFCMLIYTKHQKSRALLLFKCNCKGRQGVIQRVFLGVHGAFHCIYLIFTGCFRLSWINQYQIQLHHEKLAMETLLPI